MSESEKPWPSFNEPATKGDVIRAVVKINSTLSNLAAAVASMVGGDKDIAVSEIREALVALRALNAMMYEIGGGAVDRE